VAAIELERLTKVYPDGTRAVEELDLAVEDGEFVVFVGPSGCGKTSALRMIAGLEEITSGTVRVGGQVVNDLPPRARDIAMIFQNYALYPHMNAYDNMAFGLKMRGIDRAEIRRRVESAAEVLGLADVLGKRPRHLSGGQRQRVAMGRAIVREPEAFLMDEPLSNLDAKLRVQMRAEIARIQRDLKVTTIYVTHDQGEAMTLGDRVCVMRGGVLQQVASPSELYDRPANLFVAGFIGTPPMNLLEGDVAVDGDTLVVTIAGQRIPLAAETLRRYPGVSAYYGRRIVFGVRSDELYMATERPDLPQLSAQLQLVEQLGSHSMAYFKIDTMAIRVGSVGMEEIDEAEGDAEGVTASRPNLVASVNPAAASGLSLGETVPIGVDVAKVHLFDLDTGEPLR
jgi:multiple sugar transport system ATP-binding protein